MTEDLPPDVASALAEMDLTREEAAAIVQPIIDDLWRSLKPLYDLLVAHGLITPHEES